MGRVRQFSQIQAPYHQCSIKGPRSPSLRVQLSNTMGAGWGRQGARGLGTERGRNEQREERLQDLRAPRASDATSLLPGKKGGKNPLVVLGKVFFSLVFNIPPGFIFKSNNPASAPWQLGWCPACLSPVPAGKGQSSCCRQGLREEGCLPVSSARSLSRSICETWKGLIIRPRSCPNCDFH